MTESPALDPPLGIAEGQRLPPTQTPSVDLANAERLLRDADTVDTRFNYYRFAVLAVHHQVVQVKPPQRLELAVALRPNRCHRLAFSAQQGVTFQLSESPTYQSPMEGSSGAIGQYRTLCPASPAIAKLTISALAASLRDPIAVAIVHTESAVR